ncbi:CPBP family intramembrane metalloprotease [Enterococcus sp. ALS3]|uniref:CPBP family intramembrane metalloprotease n=1 Tax=Enterococcus alishanensis TaxID=1303817 RepID=A0ABS6TG89_9ENTE|nr:type II CAAX endopeptidase family protein [Enterococcus alishanensis]MBV7391898.1 CPBP family intramembrane metalloprotease [Enterococcus alishanensis]
MNRPLSKRELTTLLIIPLELLIGWLLSLTDLIKLPVAGPLLVFCIFFLGFLAAILLNRTFLKNSWQQYKEKLFRNFMLSVLFAVIFGVIQQVGRGLVQPASIHGNLLTMTILPTLIGALIPMMAPFTEELVFRHILFFKWTTSKTMTILMLFVSSILFGLAHFNNFQGQLIYTLPLMAGGFLFALFYYWKKNIWFSLMAHFIYNVAFSFIPAVVILFFQLFTN